LWNRWKQASVNYKRELENEPQRFGGNQMFKTLAQVKAANKAIRNHWFERSTMRFFNSKVETGLLRGRFFITSERMDLTFPKRYTVREAMPDGDIKTVGQFQGYSDLELARIAVNIADCGGE
jgi:hypothetical protein